MKRYLVFAGASYYPGGGWDDLLGTFDSLEEARDKAKTSGNDWWDIIDTTTMQKVQEND